LPGKKEKGGGKTIHWQCIGVEGKVGGVAVPVVFATHPSQKHSADRGMNFLERSDRRKKKKRKGKTIAILFH